MLQIAQAPKFRCRIVHMPHRVNLQLFRCLSHQCRTFRSLTNPTPETFSSAEHRNVVLPNLCSGMQSSRFAGHAKNKDDHTQSRCCCFHPCVCSTTKSAKNNKSCSLWLCCKFSKLNRTIFETFALFCNSVFRCTSRLLV